MTIARRPKSSYLFKLVAGAWCLVALLALWGGTALAAHFNYRVIAPAAAGEDVYGLQAMLTTLGYYRGEVTEQHDYLTQEAVRRFQENYSLPITGWVDSNTALALLSAVNQEANVAVDGQYLFLPVPPKLVDGTVYLPVIEASTLALGYQIDRDGADRLLLQFHDQQWTVAEDSAVPRVMVAKRWNDQFYLPIRALAQNVGASVTWDDRTRTARVALPPQFRPDQAQGNRFLYRIDNTAYPDRLRIALVLSSTTTEPYTPGRLERDPQNGSWQGQLSEITMTDSGLDLAINDPLLQRIELTRSQGGVTMTLIPNTEQELTWQWVLDPEHDRLILDLLRSSGK